MLVFRTEAPVKTGFPSLDRCVYLASLLRRNVDILFCINQEKAAEKFLQDKKIPFCHVKDLFKKPVKSIVFYLRHFNQKDKEILLQAKERNINTVHIAIPAGIASVSDCGCLLSGPTYAILHNKFRHFNRLERKYRKKVKNVFISLEGAVEYRVLRKTIDLLYRYRFNLKIALGFHSKRSTIKILKRIYPGIRFVGKIESLARPFFEADIALIIPGTSAYEAAAVGTPALYLVCSKDQELIAESLEKENIGMKVENLEDIIEKIDCLTLERRIAVGKAGKKYVDAKGVYRIIDFFEEKGII